MIFLSLSFLIVFYFIILSTLKYFLSSILFFIVFPKALIQQDTQEFQSNHWIKPPNSAQTMIMLPNFFISLSLTLYLFSFFFLGYMCVTSHQSVECVQIMRWLSSNLGEWPLWNLGSVAYCYVLYLSHPTLPSLHIMSLRGGEAS